MTSLGKKIRIERIINRDSGKSIIVPMDHGLTLGPISGLKKVKKTIEEVVHGGANAVVLHKGLVSEGHRRKGCDVGLIVHMSASTNMSIYPNNKTLVCSVEEAVKLGADGVSVQINLGGKYEVKMLKAFAKVSEDAYNWGMPLLAMIYARGKNIDNQFGLNEVKHAARIASEVGADIVKVSYTGNYKSFSEVVSGCSIPVLIAGGEKIESDRALLEMVKGAIDAGAAGVSIGRNIFQHKNITKIMRSISLIIHGIVGVKEALEILKDPA